MTTISTPPIQRVALYQLLIFLPVCGIMSGFDVTLAGSIMVGGLIQIVPQAWYARQAFRYRGARQVNKIVRAMYWGESGKVILTAALFVTTFILWTQLNFLAVFCAFTVMIPVGWLITLKVLNS